MPDDADLMVIDVEGGEEGIVVMLLKGTCRPRILIVELIDQHADFAAYPDLIASARRTRESLAKAGYREVYNQPVNTIFVHGPTSV